MKIAEFEKRSGLPRDTLRYYERIGVLDAPVRAANGYREYETSHLQQLAFVQKGKAIGFSLSEIRAGYQRFQKLGHLCPEFVSQLQQKEAFFTQRINEDRQAIKEIQNLLNRTE